LPGEDLIYLGDHANVPYGPRGLFEVRRFSESIAAFLRDQGVKLIAIPCHTASAAALHVLREKSPDSLIVGMEPAVKPAAEHSETGVVGVLATPTTFEGELYASVVERFAQDVTLLQSSCPGLVAEIEAGRHDGSEAERILRTALEPMLPRGLDAVVLGCTHYPFAFDTIRKIVGPDVRLIDPAPAVARRVKELLSGRDLLNPRTSGGRVRYLTTGDATQFRAQIKQLLGEDVEMEALRWHGDKVLVV
jgi:glutamate racemase